MVEFLLLDVRCLLRPGLVVEDDENDAINEEIARQALEMINDKHESGDVRSCIDLKSITDTSNDQMAKKVEDIVNRLDKEQKGGEEKVETKISNETEIETSEEKIDVSSIINKFKKHKQL